MSDIDAPRLFAIAPTPFTRDATAPDYHAMAQNVGAMMDRIPGVGVLLTGSYGEFQLLTIDERIKVCAEVKSDCAGSSIMAGAAALNTDRAVELARGLGAAGADFIMVSMPFAMELSEDDIVRHFARIAEVSDKPLVIYNNPVFGRDLPPSTLLRIVQECPQYKAVKQGTKTLPSMTQSISLLQARDLAAIYAASDLTCSAAIGAGAYGVTSTNLWAFPDVFTTLCDRASSPSRRRDLTAALAPYTQCIKQFGQPHTIKAAMRCRGYHMDVVERLPYRGLDDDDVRIVETAVATVDASVTALMDTDS